MKRLRSLVVGSLAVVALVGSAGSAQAHTSPEYFWGDAGYNETLDYDLGSLYRWGHEHTLYEVSARAINSQQNTEACVGAYENGVFVGTFVCTTRWYAGGSDLAVHAYCNCAWRQGYVTLSNAAPGRWVRGRAQEKF